MKTNIIQVAAIIFSATFASVAHAETKIVNQGRAGFAVVHFAESQNKAGTPRRETNVALVMEKPDASTTRVHTLGRAGYAVVPAGHQGR